MHAVAC